MSGWPLLRSAGLLVIALLGAETAEHQITLAAALQLAGADHVEVALAQERSFEARVRYQAARQQYLPWLTPRLGYRRLDGQTQNVQGDMLDVDKHSYGLGLSLNAEIALGEAIYDTLAARRQIDAADHETQVARQQVLFDTRRLYLTLVETQALGHVAESAVQLAQDYVEQVRQAQAAGLASAVEVARATAQFQRRQAVAIQTQGDIRVAAARLTEHLHLDDGVELRAADAELQPLPLVVTDRPLTELVTQALDARPELLVLGSMQQAEQVTMDQASNGPLIPRLVLSGSVGGLGGGRDGAPDDFGTTSEFAVGLEWRIGPGGLFDATQRDAAASRTRQLALHQRRLRDRITREVQEAHTRATTTEQRITLTQALVRTSEEALALGRERRDFGIAAVMEALSAADELVQARRDLVTVISNYNQAQAALLYALGPHR
jgi:outer membrane protein TolC